MKQKERYGTVLIAAFIRTDTPGDMGENKYIIMYYQWSPAPDIQAGFLDTINKRMVNKKNKWWRPQVEVTLKITSWTCQPSDGSKFCLYLGRSSFKTCLCQSNLWRLSSGDTTASLAVRNMWQFLRMLIIKGSWPRAGWFWLVLAGF